MRPGAHPRYRAELGRTITACAFLLATGHLAAAGDDPALHVSVKAVPGERTTFDVELQNESEQAISMPIFTTLWLTPIVDIQGESSTCNRGILTSPLDPATAKSYEPGARLRLHTLRLPTRGVRSLRVDLEALQWQISTPLSVGTTFELWEVAECPEYVLRLQVDLEGRPHATLFSRRVRVKIGAR